MPLKKQHIRRQNGFLTVLCRSGLTALMAVSLWAPVSAQSSDEKLQSNDGFRLNVDSSFSENASLINILPSNAEGAIELPGESVGSQIFDLDVSSLGCVTGEATCLSRDERLDMRYSKSVTASIDSFLDIELTPRASMRFNDESYAWYMFAGADAEAVSYSPDGLSGLTRGNVHLQDRIIVGDAQAGVGYRIGESTDISLGYFRREVTSFGRETDLNSISYSEDAAALSFTHFILFILRFGPWVWKVINIFRAE